MLYLLLCDGMGDGRCCGVPKTPLDLVMVRLGEDDWGRMEDAGVEAP